MRTEWLFLGVCSDFFLPVWLLQFREEPLSSRVSLVGVLACRLII